MKRRVAAALLCGLAALAHADATEAVPRPSCLSSPDAAAMAFVTTSIRNAQDGIPLLTPRSIASFRARLAQLLDDRYAPDSAELRRRLHVEQLAPDAAKNLSDAEFVGIYFAAGSARAVRATLLELAVAERHTERFLGEAVKVRYRMSVEGRESTQERVYYLHEDQGCWRLDVPMEASARLEQLSKVLKESRTERQIAAGKPPGFRLRVAPASESAFPFATRFDGPNGLRSPVWIANAALLTEKDLEGLSEYWDCDRPGSAVEDPALRLRFAKAAASRLESWSAQNVGSMLGVVLDGEVVVYAKVTGKLGNRLTVCLPSKTLEQLQEITRPPAD